MELFRQVESRRMTDDDLIEAFDKSRSGFSLDRLLADPDLRADFVDQCRHQGIDDLETQLAKRLLNLRKQGKLAGRKSTRTSFDDREYRFAAEIAIRHLERTKQVTLDQVLCSPDLLSDFDKLCADLSPGFSALQYRWAALSLRKSRSIAPEIMGQVIQAEEVQLLHCHTLDVDAVTNAPGLYIFFNTENNETLYVGEASNLRLRIRKHLSHSDNKYLARHIWDHGTEPLRLELHVLPRNVSTRIRRALETELIQSRRPVFNVLGRLTHDANPQKS